MPTVTVSSHEVRISSAEARRVVSLETGHTITVGGRGPQGSAGADGEGGSTFEATNKSGGQLAAGAVVATHSSGSGVVAANATNGTAEAVGLNTAQAASLGAATIQTAGPFELADWSAVTGSVSLAARATYYLDTTNGRLTATAPTGTGQIVQKVGVAVGPQTLQISIEPSLLL